MRVLGVDPGTRLCGWGMFKDGVFESCGLVRSKALTLQARAENMVSQLPWHMDPDFLILEIPQVYTHRKSKGNPNDLIKLTYVSGQIAYAAHKADAIVHALLPFGWKSNLPKRVVENNMRKEFSAEEISRLNSCLKSVPRSLQHNVIDGVALAYSFAKKARAECA